MASSLIDIDDNQILKIIKLDNKIKNNFFGLYFSDTRIEEEYFKREKKYSISVKVLMHLAYFINYFTRFFKNKFLQDYVVFKLFTYLFLSFSFILILIFYSTKNFRVRKLSDKVAAMINYIYQLLIAFFAIYFRQQTNETIRLKALHNLTFMSILEILLTID